MPITPPPDWQQAPTAFVANAGQAPGDTKFVSLSVGHQLEITPNGARLHKVGLTFQGATPTKPVAEKPVATKFQYYAGKRSVTDVPAYAQVRQPNLYPGIDAVYYGTQSALEYDMVVHPGGDPSRIAVRLSGGAKQLSDGTIEIDGWRHQAPVAYQLIGGERRRVPARAELKGDTLRFAVGAYDRSKELIIDPVLSQVIDLGPRGFDANTAITVGADGSIVVARTNDRSVFRPLATVFDTDIRIAKFTASGALSYLALIVGEDDDTVYGVAVNSAGNVFAAGNSKSRDLPTTANAFQSRRKLPICAFGVDCRGASYDNFALKLTPTGQVEWLTYFGSNSFEEVGGVALNAANQLYVTGLTSGLLYPTKNQFQGCRDGGPFSGSAFLTVFNASGSDLVYSTCIRSGVGGTFNRSSEAEAVIVDAAGNAYIAGLVDDGTGSSSFPVRGVNGANPFQATSRGEIEGFVAKFNPNRSGDASLLYSTLLGGAGDDHVYSLTVDAAGQACVAGETSSVDFPVRAPALTLTPLNTYKGATDWFVTCLNASASDISFSNLYGGSNDDYSPYIASDTGGNLWIGGYTFSPDIAAVNPLEGASGGGLLLKLASGTREVGIFSQAPSFISGIATNGASVFVAGSDVDTVIECARELGFIRINQGPIVFDVGANRFRQTINLAHSGPLLFTPPGTRLVFTGLSSTVTLANASGTTTCFEPGSPFLTLPLLPSIAQGGVNIDLEFVPKRGASGVTYTPKFATAGVLP